MESHEGGHEDGTPARMLPRRARLCLSLFEGVYHALVFQLRSLVKERAREGEGERERERATERDKVTQKVTRVVTRVVLLQVLLQ